MLHGPVSANKYYIYSAIGRTGSTRLCNLIHPGPHCLWAPFVKDELTTQTVIHSHTLVFPVPEGFQPILSTRKDKRDIVLSNFIARKTGDWIPGKAPPTIKPFSVDINDYIALTKQVILKEEQFIKKNNPIIIYLEDSVDLIENKLNTALLRAADRTTVSKHPPDAYIANYTECLNAYMRLASASSAEQFAKSDAKSDAQSDAQ